MYSFAILNSSSFGKHYPEHIEEVLKLGKVKVVNVPANISGKELAVHFEGVDGIIASVTPRMDRDFLESCPQLKIIARHGIGCDNVDLQAASELGIIVSRVQGIIEQDAVSEMAVGLMLSAIRYIPNGFNSVRNSKWSERASYLGSELKSKKIGLIGLGNIGRRVAEILNLGFKAEVLAYDPYLDSAEISKRYAKSVSFDELLKDSEVISFHCPLTVETKRFFSKEVFTKLKKGVLLVNTCRGELLDEDALIDSINNGIVSLYSTDVVEGEPIDGEHRLLKMKEVLVTPHLGGYTENSLFGMGQTMVNDLVSIFKEGKLPECIANPAVLKESLRASSFLKK